MLKSENHSTVKRFNGESRLLKRLLEMMIAAMGLFLLSPLLVLVAVLIRIDSRGPVFFRQERVGQGFRPFLILKFRTMMPDAHRFGRQITAGADPRITKIGKVLRRSKIDELPQLLNVLKGDMSFVGPRPEVSRYVELYRQDFKEILQVRPGITDLASIKYRDEAELLGSAEDPEREYIERILPDKLRLAKEYVRRSSLWFDFSVIFKTLILMVRD
jgi:lipopolysaccharide/colanic/teichoic acid biosynthesis glycosyltransferase